MGGAHPARAPPKIGKIWFFGVKSWFFTRNTPKNFAPPLARRNFFKCPPPLTWNPGSAPDLYLINHVSAVALTTGCINTVIIIQEVFEDTKGVIRIRKSEKDRQHNGKKKKVKQRSTKHYTEN
jgi:hypothetical protein